MLCDTVLKGIIPTDLVVDLFGGSGSTLIACEKLGRVARLMEIEPRYADAIIERFETFTSRPARLLDGRSFQEVAQERRAAAAELKEPVNG